MQAPILPSSCRYRVQENEDSCNAIQAAASHPFWKVDQAQESLGSLLLAVLHGKLGKALPVQCRKVRQATGRHALSARHQQGLPLHRCRWTDLPAKSLGLLHLGCLQPSCQKAHSLVARDQVDDDNSSSADILSVHWLAKDTPRTHKGFFDYFRLGQEHNKPCWK